MPNGGSGRTKAVFVCYKFIQLDPYPALSMPTMRYGVVASEGAAFLVLQTHGQKWLQYPPVAQWNTESTGACDWPSLVGMADRVQVMG